MPQQLLDVDYARAVPRETGCRQLSASWACTPAAVPEDVAEHLAERRELLAIGPELARVYWHAATRVDKILKGAKPTDIPVEQPTEVDVVINLKTAHALGLTIPQSVLLQPTEVIQ